MVIINFIGLRYKVLVLAKILTFPLNAFWREMSVLDFESTVFHPRLLRSEVQLLYWIFWPRAKRRTSKETPNQTI